MPINFKEYIQESKSLELTPEEYEKVTTLSKKYIELIDKKPRPRTQLLPQHFFKDIKIKKNSNITPRFLKLESIQLTDRSTGILKSIDVIVIFDYPDPPYSGLYRQQTEEILLFHDMFVNYSYYRIFEIISHEIIHAIQHYKTTSAKYIKAVKKDIYKDEIARKDYYTEPLEFEATLSGIISQLKLVYIDYITRIENHKINNEHVAANFLLRKLAVFLKSLKTFATSSPETYFVHNELDIPQPLQGREIFFNTVYSDLRYRRKYQRAVLSLVLDINTRLLEKGIELDL